MGAEFANCFTKTKTSSLLSFPYLLINWLLQIWPFLDTGSMEDHTTSAALSNKFCFFVYSANASVKCSVFRTAWGRVLDEWERISSSFFYDEGTNQEIIRPSKKEINKKSWGGIAKKWARGVCWLKTETSPFSPFFACPKKKTKKKECFHPFPFCFGHTECKRTFMQNPRSAFCT